MCLIFLSTSEQICSRSFYQVCLLLYSFVENKVSLSKNCYYRGRRIDSPNREKSSEVIDTNKNKLLNVDKEFDTKRDTKDLLGILKATTLNKEEE